ncbi:hypothetical protein AB1Y20_020236 [Prymnesium parvum]|uniref:DNA/RNA-binding protein Alba-like domain-containing protein n=1 Tax=Prymnesium parvum TaxID=97485 RepID=A0AB34JXC9_PRYPA
MCTPDLEHLRQVGESTLEAIMYQDNQVARGRGGGGGYRSGPGQHAGRRPLDDDAKPGSDFWDRVQRGNNTTKVGANSNPRDIASQIAAQARAAVDCPILQCVGPSSINQAIKAVAIARTYLAQSDQSGQSSHPDLTLSPEFVKLDGQQMGRDDQLSAVQLVISKRVRRPSVDKEGRSLKVSKDTEAKSLAGAIANCTRVGERIELTAIGAGSVNQAIKAIAIARQYVEEEAIDLCFRPGFVEISDNQLGEGGATSALRLVVLVEQC